MSLPGALIGWMLKDSCEVWSHRASHRRRVSVQSLAALLS
jgi:hypothetical protein